MKIEDMESRHQISGAVTETAFGIGNAKLLLEYLRSNIYKNPIQALCREIPSNARDAHREVSSDPNNPTTAETPIRIQVPNEWDPQFIVQDWGPGISPQRMSEIFTQFGNSTKRSSNEETGGFGLGCKTPFAYGDSFSVITVHDGIKYHYSAILDGENGKMILLSSGETDETSGTIIAVPVADKDFDSFISYTMLAVAFWKTPPTIDGIKPAPRFPKIDSEFSGDNWRLLNSEDISHISRIGNGSYAIVDGIPYAIETSSLDFFTYEEKQLLRNCLHFDFAVGELDLAPSRDNLRYTEKTCRAIAERFRQAESELQSLIDEKVRHAPTYVEACRMYRKLQTSIAKDVLGYLERPTWNDKKISFDLQLHQVGRWSKVNKFHLQYGVLKSTRTSTVVRPVNEKVLVLLNDEEKSMPRKSIELLIRDDQNPYTIVEIITLPKSPKSKDWLRYRNSNPGAVPSYDTELLELYEIQNLSTYPMPKAPRTPGRGGRRKAADGNIMAYSFRETSRGDIATNSHEVPNDGGIYIKVDYKARTYKTNSRMINYYRDLRWLEDFLGEEIHGFSEGRIKKLSSNWIPLEEAVREKVEESLDEVNLDELKKAKASETARFHSQHYRMSKIENHLAEMQDGSIIAEYIQKSKDVRDTLELVHEHFWWILNWLGYDTSYENIPCELTPLNEKMKETYPLLSYLRDLYDSEKLVAAIEYINLIDEKNLGKDNSLVALAS